MKGVNQKLQRNMQLKVKMLSQPNECKILGRHNSYTMKKRMEEACFVNAGWIVEQILFIPGIFCHLLDQE